MTPFRVRMQSAQDTNGVRESHLRVSDFLVRLVRLESEGRLVEASGSVLGKVPVLTGDKVYFVLDRSAGERAVFVSEIIVAAPVSRFRGPLGLTRGTTCGYIPVLRLLRDRADGPWQEEFEGHRIALGMHA